MKSYYDLEWTFSQKIIDKTEKCIQNAHLKIKIEERN